ncbi:MAG: reverse transcriptase/maturase family protein [Candidatus Taylorbacteria bacterium]|nr:reverse transcriptase/maturase family protein [Candidatus Taylorbacteria bacterium]
MKKFFLISLSFNLSHNIFDLKEEVISGSYYHGNYEFFQIREPKLRDIHKATVRDRIMHHAIYRAVYPYFDKLFIFDSYSCRLDKGTHKALARFKSFVRKESLNNTKTVWILKGDIRKCFASIDHQILKNIISRHIICPKSIQVIYAVIDSFPKGIPLGNLTSQLFINLYLNEFDQYVKRVLKVSKYIRYADDFVIFSRNKIWLENLILDIKIFLADNLKLELHPDKVFIKTASSGLDFLGWVHFEKYHILRTRTKIRMYQTIFPDTKSEVIASYLGLLDYGNTFKIKTDLLEKIEHLKDL